MTDLYYCGQLWQTMGDLEAGWKLLRFVGSSDVGIRTAAEDFLVQAGPRSLKLLQTAAASRSIDSETASRLIVTVMTAMWWDDTAYDSGPEPQHYDA